MRKGTFKAILPMNACLQCESGKELWLQGEAAFKTQSFRDAEPQLVIPPKIKKNHGVLPVQLRPGINICLTTTDPCLAIIARKCNDAYCFWSSQLVPSNPMGQYFLFICLSFAVWLCLKKCSENRVLVVLLQIEAKDLRVFSVRTTYLVSKHFIMLYNNSFQTNSSRATTLVTQDLWLNYIF